MVLWQSLKKAQEQSKGTIQDYWRVSDGIMTVLKESPGAIQRYYPRLLTHSDGIMTVLKESPGAIQRYYPRLLTHSDGIMTVP